MNIEGSGELEDGTMYNRKLTIKETTETQLLGLRTVTKEVTEDTVVIAGMGVRRVTREREVTEDRLGIAGLGVWRVDRDVMLMRTESQWDKR